MATLVVLRKQANEWTDAQRLRFARVRSSPFLRNVGVLSRGTAIGHVFTLASAPLLTRIYGPSDFGVLGLFTSFLSTAAVAVALQYELSIVSGRNKAEAEYLTLAALLFAFPVSAVAGGVLWGLIHFGILGFGRLPGGAPLLITPALLCVGVFTALRYWCLREEQFGQVSDGVVAQSAGRSIFQTVLGSAGLHTMGLLYGETIGRCLGMSRMIRNAWPALRRRLHDFRAEEFKQALWRNRKFPLYSLPSSLLDSICMALPLPMLIQLYGPSVGGHYSLVWRAITVPSVLVTAAVADTFHSRMATYARETPEKVRALFHRTTAALLAIGVIPAATLWFSRGTSVPSRVWIAMDAGWLDRRHRCPLVSGAICCQSAQPRGRHLQRPEDQAHLGRTLRGLAGGCLFPGTLQSVASLADGSTADTREYWPLPGLLPVAAADDPAGERFSLRSCVLRVKRHRQGAA